jgi:orotate phosphoribosyltransferase
VPETRAQNRPVALRGESQRVAELLAIPGAVNQGHFELLAGAHTDTFFRFSALARNPAVIDEIVGWLEEDLRSTEADCVLAPTTAGVGLGWTMATLLGVPLHLATVDERSRPVGVLGEPDLDGRRALLVNDVVTTGFGLQSMIDLARERGGEAVGATWFLTRSERDLTDALDLPAFAVAEWHLPAWSAEECELCRRGDEVAFALDLN